MSSRTNALDILQTKLTAFQKQARKFSTSVSPGMDVTSPVKVPYYRITGVTRPSPDAITTTISSTQNQLHITMDLTNVDQNPIVTLMFVVNYIMLLCDALITDPNANVGTGSDNIFQKRFDPKLAEFGAGGQPQQPGPDSGLSMSSALGALSELHQNAEGGASKKRRHRVSSSQIKK